MSAPIAILERGKTDAPGLAKLRCIHRRPGRLRKIATTSIQIPKDSRNVVAEELALMTARLGREIVNGHSSTLQGVQSEV